MRTLFTAGLTGMLALGMTGIAMAQENAPQPQGPNQARQGIHGPRSIDQELDHLTKDLELTPNQQKQIRPLLEQHHDRIQDCSTTIQGSHAETAARRSTRSATKRTTKLKRS